MSDTPERTSRTREAMRLIRDAASARRLARDGGPAAETLLDQAQAADAAAVASLTLQGVPVVRCGEIVAVEGQADAVPDEVRLAIRDGQQVAADASLARTDLLLSTGDERGLALAVDAAVSSGAEDALQRQGAHLLAMLYEQGLKLTRNLNKVASRRDRYTGEQSAADVTEHAKLTGTLARVTNAYLDGYLKLKQAQRGASQTIKVEHVNVAPGAQAVIAGSVRTGSKRSRRTRGGKGT